MNAALIGTMPVGGVQSQNPTQGLVHWMSAVMAEHMTSNSHHDPTVGMHYMWNGGVDVSFHYDRCENDMNICIKTKTNESEREKWQSCPYNYGVSLEITSKFQTVV